jgi:hypothetical protein
VRFRVNDLYSHPLRRDRAFGDHLVALVVRIALSVVAILIALDLVVWLLMNNRRDSAGQR